MFETPFAMVGNIVTDPIHRRVGDQQVTKFRVASNSRRRAVDGTWEAGNSLFVNVNCWGRLVAGVSALIKGDPVVVVGHLYTSEYDDREGNRRSSVEVRAMAVGPDLARSTVRVDQPKRSELPAEAQDPVAEDDAAPATDDESADEPDDADDEGLPLTA
jgi:single-strand DNA-binding protein